MNEKHGRGAPSQSVQLGESATIISVGPDKGFSGRALLARAISNHERGMPGRISA